MGRESAPCRPEHLGEIVFIWDLSDNDLCLTSIFGGTPSIHCGSRFPGRNGTFGHSFGQIIPTFRRSPSFSHAQSFTQFAIVHALVPRALGITWSGPTSSHILQTHCVSILLATCLMPRLVGRVPGPIRGLFDQLVG